MRELALTVLVPPGPQALTYLAALRGAGLRPARALRLVPTTHPTTGAPVLSWLPGFLRRPLTRELHDQAMAHWPRALRTAHPDLVRDVTAAIAGSLGEDAPGWLARAHAGIRDLHAYAGAVDEVHVPDLRAPELAAALRRGPRAVLYAGRALVPRALLADPNLRFLHVHPGVLPRVRGADGLLWSLLVRGRMGASGFVMAPGLDTGDVVATREFGPLRVPLPPGTRPGDDALYRILMGFVDPALRARVLIDDVLAGAAGDLEDLPATPQDLAAGTTFHFMHPRLRSRVLRRVFPDGPQGS